MLTLLLDFVLLLSTLQSNILIIFSSVVCFGVYIDAAFLV